MLSEHKQPYKTLLKQKKVFSEQKKSIAWIAGRLPAFNTLSNKWRNQKPFKSIFF